MRSLLLTVVICVAGLGPAAQAALPGDAARGERLYQSRCGFCHSPDHDRFGPRHRGVFGRRAASVPGYRYSAALAAQTFTWNAATLDRWLEDPRRFVPGAAMSARTKDPQQRADLIAYLKSLGAR
jgi:cytochrome c